MKAVSIDLETTGLDPKTCQILEIGLVAFNTHEPFAQTTDNTLRIVFVRERLEGGIYALNLNRDLISEILEASQLLKNKGYEFYYEDNMTTLYVQTKDINSCAQTVSSVINEFLLKNGYDIKKDKITAAGKNFASFDKKFIDEECALGGALNSIRHRVLDVGPMYITYDDSSVPGLATCLERAGYPKTVPHNAIDDAILVIKCIHAKTMPGFFYTDRRGVDQLEVAMGQTVPTPEFMGEATTLQPDYNVQEFKNDTKISEKFFGNYTPQYTNLTQEAKAVLDRTAPTNFISPIQDNEFGRFTEEQ